MKTALVTGASSGIGAAVARRLDSLGFNVILTARRADRLEALASELENEAAVITADLSQKSECFRLYEEVKDRNVSVVINNAGFGLLGDFDDTDLDRELSMIDVNCAAVHILTKLFLKDLIARDRGYILNVGSSAGLMPGGPLMATYYATKAYVVSLTQSIDEELRARLEHVAKGKKPESVILWGSILAAGGFTVFFGGTVWDGLTAAAFALLICFLQKQLGKTQISTTGSNLFISFLTGLGVGFLCRVVPVLHMDMILIGDIMLLIPGIAMTNSIRNMLGGNTISGAVRLLESLIWAVALAGGFMTAMLIVELTI